MPPLKVQSIKNISFLDARENILYDDLLLSQAEMAASGASANTLRLWESPVPFIVLGRTGKAEDDLHLSAVKTDRVPVLRRSSGGGTVVQGPGCLNFSLIVHKDTVPGLHDLRKSYHILLEEVLLLLKRLGVNAVFRPISDLALAGAGDGPEKKFSGNAQKRGRSYILHHGTLLYRFDLGLISRYLTMPQDIPPYRQGRSHRDFVTNLPFEHRELVEAFHASFRSPATAIHASVTDPEQRVLDQWLKERPVTVEIS